MIRINPHKVLLTLLTINFILAILYVGSQITQKLEEPLNLDGEANVPAWYSGVQLLLIAFPAFIRGAQMREENRASHWRIYMLIALGATFLSADEIGMIHESLRPILTYHVFGRVNYPDGKDAIGLVVAGVYGVVGLILFALFWKQAIAFLKEKPGRFWVLFGGAVFVFGAVFVDEFMPYAHPVYEHAVEELCELCGTTFVLYGMLLKLKPVVVEVSGASPPPRVEHGFEMVAKD